MPQRTAVGIPCFASPTAMNDPGSLLGGDGLSDLAPDSFGNTGIDIVPVPEEAFPDPRMLQAVVLTDQRFDESGALGVVERVAHQRSRLAEIVVVGPQGVG